MRGSTPYGITIVWSLTSVSKEMKGNIHRIDAIGRPAGGVRTEDRAEWTWVGWVHITSAHGIKFWVSHWATRLKLEGCVCGSRQEISAARHNRCQWLEDVKKTPLSRYNKPFFFHPDSWPIDVHTLPPDRMAGQRGVGWTLWKNLNM